MDISYLSFEQPIAELQEKIDALRMIKVDDQLNISEEIDRLSEKSEDLNERKPYLANYSSSFTRIHRFTYKMNIFLFVYQTVTIKPWCLKLSTYGLLKNKYTSKLS